LLSQYAIKDTIVQPDFNTNNILINPDPKKLTFIDLGEIAITHPFFSLLNFLYQAIIHHGVEEGVDQEALKVYYANRPNQLIQAFREYIAS
jgi:aminoglycoside phosphotransferase (APT) family kinase protein